MKKFLIDLQVKEDQTPIEAYQDYTWKMAISILTYKLLFKENTLKNVSEIKEFVQTATLPEVSEFLIKFSYVILNNLG